MPISYGFEREADTYGDRDSGKNKEREGEGGREKKRERERERGRENGEGDKEEEEREEEQERRYSVWHTNLFNEIKVRDSLRAEKKALVTRSVSVLDCKQRSTHR